jgi:hypothetical protein
MSEIISRLKALKLYAMADGYADLQSQGVATTASLALLCSC